MFIMVIKEDLTEKVSILGTLDNFIKYNKIILLIWSQIESMDSFIDFKYVGKLFRLDFSNRKNIRYYVPIIFLLVNCYNSFRIVLIDQIEIESLNVRLQFFLRT